MIQRIQSVFLLLSGLLMGSLFFFPLAVIQNKEGESFDFIYRGLINADGESIFPALALAILLTIATLVSFVTIFLYKKRILQLRLCGLNIGLLLGSVGMIYYLATEATAEVSGIMMVKMTSAFPIVAVVLTILAMRSIGKDVALLKSMDRIR